MSFTKEYADAQLLSCDYRMCSLTIEGVLFKGMHATIPTMQVRL